MSNKTAISNGKMITVCDLENSAIQIENNLEDLNKHIIKKMLNLLQSIMTIAQRKEDGIFNIILRWFRLYLKFHVIINPDDQMLLKYYENSAPIIITYIIGCLQYKTDEVPNYHFHLLEILEEIMAVIPPRVLKETNKFQKGTIGCLWNPIDLAGDFNTQLKALKILSVFLKQFDEKRQNEELKYIKWTNLNLFQDKLKAIVQSTKLSHVLDNCSRELLNNYNMNLAKDVKVYSFYCKSIILGNKHKFYKPLNLEKFWIDINYCPKTVSFNGRFKLNSISKYENINVILKIQNMLMKHSTLQIYFIEPGKFSEHFEYLSNIEKNIVEFTLTKEESKRLMDNDYVIKYFNNLRASSGMQYKKTDKNNSKFDILKIDMSKTLQEDQSRRARSKSNFVKRSLLDLYITSTPEDNLDYDETAAFTEMRQPENFTKIPVESSKNSENLENYMKKNPIRNLRNKKKFFTSLLTENSCDELVNKKSKRKKLQKTKSRQTKSRNKKVCKVIPTVDLTKTENTDSMNTNAEMEKISVNDNDSRKTFPLINTSVCYETLKKVSDIYNVGDTTYAKPCQSYRNFQTLGSPMEKPFDVKERTKAIARKKKLNEKNESSVEKKRTKFSNYYSQENKENINPHNHNIADRPSSKIVLSPHLFETQCSDEMHNSNILPLPTNENFKNIVKENLEIDLTLDENQVKETDNNEVISNCSSLECEQVRILDENYFQDIDYIHTPTKNELPNISKITTPRSTSSMHLSNFNDSDMDITQIYNSQNRQNHQSKLYDENSISVPNDNLDMQLTQCYYNLDFCEEQTSANVNKTTNIQPNCELFKENKELPAYLQQIINDFDCGSVDEFDSIYKIPTEGTSGDIVAQEVDNKAAVKRNYKNDCIVFRNRNDAEEYYSSDESGGNDGLSNISDSLQNNKLSNRNLAFMQNMPSYSNQNLYQENGFLITPGKNNKIEQNFTSRLITKCQVSPEAIILQQYEVSAKKSVILRNKTSKEAPRANKCLNNYFIEKNTNALEFQRHNFEEATCALPSNRNPTNSKFVINQNFNGPDILKVPEVAMKNLLPEACTKNLESLLQQQSSLRDSNLGGSQYRNTNKKSPIGDIKTQFKKDLLNIVKDYDSNIKQSFNTAMRLFIENISDKYTSKFLEITKSVLKKSNENRMELEQIHSNISRLVRDLEWQYDAFRNKSNEFDIYREATEHIMKSKIHMDVSNCINQDYDHIIEQLNIEQNGVFQNVWQKYLSKQRISTDI